MCDGVDNIRAVIKGKNSAVDGYFKCQLVIQYAEVRADNPRIAAPTALGSVQTDDFEYGTGDIAVNGAGAAIANRFFRLGIAYYTNTGGSGAKQADVSLQASWKQLGTYLGSQRLELSVVDSGKKDAALTPWIPATYMTKVKVAFVVNGIFPSNGNFGYRLAVQTAATSVEQPGAWTDYEAGWTQPGSGTTYSERNTGEVTVTTTDMWFRLGVAYQQAGGVDTNYTAQLEACCAAR